MNLDISREYFGPSTRFYIVAGSQVGVNGDAQNIATLSQSDPNGPKYTSKVDDIKSILNSYVPSEGITVFTYTRQYVQEVRDAGGAWGKAAVSCYYYRD